MTGVGSITMSGDLKIGNGTSPNTIYFYGTTGDGPGSYSHTFIAERFGEVRKVVSWSCLKETI